MELQRALEADYPAVVQLANLAYRGAGGWTTETAYIEGLRLTEEQLKADLAAKPEALLMIACDEDAGSLLGTVWLEHKGEGVWYLGLLTVRPDLQQLKLGRALLAAAEGHVRGAGGTRIRLTVVNVRQTLIEWYERRGYRLTGEVEAFPYCDARFGKPLRNDLGFVVLEKGL